MKKPILYGLASALITAAVIKAVPAFAQEQAPAGETYVSLVKTADLDLGSETGRRLLDQRLARAAREVCGTASDADVEGKNEVRKCRDGALARVQADRDVVLAAGRRGAPIAVTASR